MPASAITIRIYTVNPATGQRCEVRTVRYSGGEPAVAFTCRWPDCDHPQHREQTW